MYASIFVRNLTIIDSAVGCFAKGVCGLSCHVDVEWFGQTDENGILIDFGEAKKLAKKVIDEEFDHRLILPAACERTPSLKGQEHSGALFALPIADCSGTFPAVIMAPRSHFCFLPLPVSSGTDNWESTKAQLVPAVRDALLRAAPEQVQDVQITLRQEELEPGIPSYTYLHSLRQHAGNCQRFHGHSNRIEVFDKAGNRKQELEQKIAQSIDGKYLIPENYLASAEESASERFHCLRQWLAGAPHSPSHGSLTETDWVDIHYMGNQGPVSLILPQACIEWTSSESTVENIAVHLHSQYCGSDSSLRVRAYEGISKGSTAGDWGVQME